MILFVFFATAFSQNSGLIVNGVDVDEGCPDGNRPDFNLDFSNPTVVHQNLGGHYCQPDRWIGQTYPSECADQLNGEPIPEILYCNVGETSDGKEVCLRVEDVSADFSGMSAYQCENTEKCGNVREANSVYGQVQIDMGGGTCRLRFTTVTCEGGYEQQDCQPALWDAMVMTFLDIDGALEDQEVVTLYDILNYDMAFGYDQQDVYGSDAYPNGFPNCEFSNNVNNQRMCFPNMQVQVEDPSGVYQYRLTENGARQVNPTIGDVVLRNNDLLDSNTEPNPTSLSDMTPGQLQRSGTGIWVSDKILNMAFPTVYPNRPQDMRSSFDVSMGTQKRTILFAGFSAAVSGCGTCGDVFFTEGGSCPDGYRDLTDRICQLPSENIDSCTQDFCCEEEISSHGDPIIWTFNEECYDLNKDGIYQALVHPRYDHEMRVAVHNDFMREVQIVDVQSEEIMLSINTNGEMYKSEKWTYRVEHKTIDCPTDGSVKETECVGTYEEWEFDATAFLVTVQLLRHDYLDPALQDGELGYHLDIYPRPFKSFRGIKDEFTGIYFANPLPEELEYCPGGSPRVHYA